MRTSDVEIAHSFIVGNPSREKPAKRYDTRVRRLLMLVLLTGCETTVPQTILEVGADPQTVARTVRVDVTILGHEGDVRLERSVVLAGADAETMFPLTIPLAPDGNNASRTWRAEIRAFDAAGEIALLGAAGSYASGRVQRIVLQLTDACLDHPGCSAGQTCVEGLCLGECFAASEDGSVQPACGECEACDGGRCVPLNDVPCGCAGQSCSDGVCSTSSFPAQLITTGSEHSCAVLDDRDLWCWGTNGRGELGVPGAQPSPARITSDVITAAAGGHEGDAHTCWIEDRTGILRCTGSNTDGQLGVGDYEDRASGTVVAGEYRAVATGDRHTCAIRRDGSMACWGSSSNGKLGIGTDVGDPNTPRDVETTLSWLDVCAGATHTCALAEDRTLHCWGLNDCGALGLGADRERKLVPTALGLGGGWLEVACGAFHACALDAEGEIHCWGGGSNGNLGRGSFEDSGEPRPIDRAGPFESLACGGSHCCAIDATTAGLVCWGGDAAGEIGVGSPGMTYTRPVELLPITRWISVSAGTSHTCAISSDRSVWCWGDNSTAALGIEGGSRSVPARVCFSE